MSIQKINPLLSKKKAEQKQRNKVTFLPTPKTLHHVTQKSS